MNISKNQRRFELVRHQDVTGTSGTGMVAEGCLWSDGKVSVRWMSECGSFICYDSVQAAIQVHGHGGRTVIKWLDPDGFVDWRKMLEELAGQEKIEDHRQGVKDAIALLSSIL